MNKKIVISSNTSWSIYNVRLNLARTLKDKGYEIIIVAPYDKYAEKLKQEFEYYDMHINSKGTNPIEDIRILINYYKLYKKIKPNLVINFTIKPNIYGSIAAKMNNLPSIAVITGLGYIFIKKSLLTNLVKKLYKFAFNNTYKIGFLNQDDVELMLKERLVKKEQAFILPSEGIDIEEFKPILNKNKGEKLKFLLIARMLWDKGIGEYVNAAKLIKQKYNNVEFLLVGPIGVDNPSAISKNTIEEWEKEGWVMYLGVVDNIKEYIEKSDCIVLPSFYREGIPRTLLEGASMAKPLITTNTVGCKEVVEDGINGFLCEVKNAKDLADKMEKMLNLSEEQRIQMGIKGREKVLREFDEKIVIEKYIKVIKEIDQV